MLPLCSKMVSETMITRSSYKDDNACRSQSGSCFLSQSEVGLRLRVNALRMRRILIGHVQLR